jgi:predicted alpha/beta-fold hydrolase
MSRKNLKGVALLLVVGARVFTAADSDDVRLVVQHIKSAQPRVTVMGVGWGFGANMLAKYLGEEAASASLVAAVCISNPFDLQETSRHLSSIKGGKFDRAMADGLVRILETNKVSLTQQTVNNFS